VLLGDRVHVVERLLHSALILVTPTNRMRSQL